VTQDHVSPTSGDSSIDSLFETTMRGYHKRQVDEYIGWLRAELGSSQEDARTAREQAEEHSRDLQRLKDDLAQVRSESSVASKPQHEEVSERLAQILRLADEEADQKRARAAEEADGALEAARDQSAKVLEAARSAAEGIISAARERAEKEAAAAKAEAETLLANAASSSQATLEDAELRAAHVLSDSDRRTAQITSLQDERLAALREVHTDTLRRLEVVRGALEKVLTAEIDAGPPDSGIDSAPLPAAGAAMTAAEVDVPALTGAPAAEPAVEPEAVADVEEVPDAFDELEDEPLRASDYADAALTEDAAATTGALHPDALAEAVRRERGLDAEEAEVDGTGRSLGVGRI